MPPQPQHARLATPLAARQSFDLYQDERPDHYGQKPAAPEEVGGLPSKARTRPVLTTERGQSTQTTPKGLGLL